MSILKYSTEMTLFNSYFNKDKELTQKAILSIFQDVASHHAESIGLGFKDMLDLNLYWVLSRVKYDIIKMPTLYQRVVVETWPHEKGRVDFDRDIKISSLDGETLIKGTTKWCVIDTKTRMLQRTSNVNYIGEYYLEKNYDDRFNKITLPETLANYTYTHIVRYFDLDPNDHMNNTNYALLIANVINNKNPHHFEINFLNECLLGDEIELEYIKEDSAEYVIGKVGERIVFVSKTF